MKTRRILSLMFVLCIALLASADDKDKNKKFSPEKFDEELHKFIVSEAKLTTQEAAKFLPVYIEMQNKQRQLFFRQRGKGFAEPTDEKAFRNAIQERDQADVEMKQMQQTYHNKFLKILPASKVYEIIKAEDKFHRRMFKNMDRMRSQQRSAFPMRPYNPQMQGRQRQHKDNNKK